jgi:phosphoribosylcarboxyaminoimidazole (NCAIR) mutase
MRAIAMDIRTYLATRLAGVGSLLGVIVMTSAITIGAAQAQNAATTASRTSLSGTQSVITHIRDRIQRRMQTVRLRSQHHRLRGTKPDAPDSIAK